MFQKYTFKKGFDMCSTIKVLEDTNYSLKFGTMNASLLFYSLCELFAVDAALLIAKKRLCETIDIKGENLTHIMRI